ncbi:MAG: hypothetical protein JW751_16755 [Polyangiaceae bacterium]|nr:hypothetical protein [Polyangiaceae bacterium]
MKTLRAWLARERRRLERTPRLADALVTDRGLWYAAYRLRYGVVRVALRTALHVVELALLSLVFPLSWLAPVFIVRTASSLFAVLWWGGLEALREQVRRLARERRGDAVGGVIDDWLVLSVIVAAALQLVAVGWAAFGPDPVGGFSIFDAYAIAAGIRVGLETIARTYHSGIFALRRIYRPLWTLLLIDVFDLLGPLLLWRAVGTWSFATSILAVGLLRVGILLHYTRRGYRGARLADRQLLQAARRAPRRLAKLGLGTAASHALAAAAGQVDSLVLMALVAGSRAGTSLRLAATLFVLSPLLGAGVGWARVFYFDFKRLQRGAPLFLVERFEGLVGNVAGGFPILCWALGFASASLVAPEVVNAGSLVLLPFLVARSLFALRHVQAFAYQDHRVQAALALAVLVGLGLVVVLPEDEHLLLGALTLVLVVAIVAVPAARRPASGPSLDSVPELPLLRWLPAGVAAELPARIWRVRHDRRLASGGKLRVALRRVVGAGAFTSPAADSLLLLSLGEAERDRERRSLIRAAGGCILAIDCLGAGPNGRSAIAAAVREPALVEALGGADTGRRRTRRADDPPGSSIPDALCAEFGRRFPDGEILRMDRRADARFRRKKPADVRQLVALVTGVSSPRPVERVWGAEVDGAVYAPLGEPELVFVMRRSSPQEPRGNFKRRVWAASLAASLIVLELTE